MKTALERDRLIATANKALAEFKNFEALPEVIRGEGVPAVEYSPPVDDPVAWAKFMYEFCVNAYPTGRNGQMVVGRFLS